jgi:hypothetical protein
MRITLTICLALVQATSASAQWAGNSPWNAQTSAPSRDGKTAAPTQQRSVGRPLIQRIVVCTRGNAVVNVGDNANISGVRQTIRRQLVFGGYIRCSA